MVSAARNEIEYLRATDGNGSHDAMLIQEMSRRLDALRRYDQYFCEADFHPKRLIRRLDPPRKAS